MDINNTVTTEIVFPSDLGLMYNKCISETYSTINNAVREVGKANVTYHYLPGHSRFLLFSSSGFYP